MTSLRDFSKVKSVAGVNEYVLVRQDGHVVVHEARDHEALGHIVQLCGANCDAIKTDIPGRFHYFLYNRDCGEHLLVFPVGSYYLGILQSSAVESSHLALAVQTFIRTLINQARQA
ncbi:MAG: hypothetical protein C0613_09775 [Desulfobulbaceae bacterium]|nr:MAG: hypothetical protein C0613_09775 [Desulfobulbaceae bacterium]